MNTQIDNSHLPLKLNLRRAMLAEAAWPTVDVLDLCSGAGHIWTALRREFPIRRYLACDRNPRQPGAIRGEAADFARSLDLAPYNVIDVDTYGEPWEPLLAAAPRLTSPTIVFLTHGRPNNSAMGVSTFVRAAAGLPVDWPIPGSIELVQYLGMRALSAVWSACTIRQARRILCPRVTYWGLLLDPHPPRRPGRRRQNPPRSPKPTP